MKKQVKSTCCYCGIGCGVVIETKNDAKTDVSDVQIQQALADGVGLAQLLNALKCATFCGSCLPEIKRTVALQATAMVSTV